MLKEQEKENVRESIKAILKMALTVEATRDEYGEDLAERLETTAKKNPNGIRNRRNHYEGISYRKRSIKKMESWNAD